MKDKLLDRLGCAAIIVGFFLCNGLILFMIITDLYRF